ncbi:hypothetical protein BJV74DRAFT_853534 [Russula compacta]|nr:hypothetical protein BJV74DRAFT_853534 [Russula compacta]
MDIWESLLVFSKAFACVSWPFVLSFLTTSFPSRLATIQSSSRGSCTHPPPCQCLAFFPSSFPLAFVLSLLSMCLLASVSYLTHLSILLHLYL